MQWCEPPARTRFQRSRCYQSGVIAFLVLQRVTRASTLIEAPTTLDIRHCQGGNNIPTDRTDVNLWIKVQLRTTTPCPQWLPVGFLARTPCNTCRNWIRVLWELDPRPMSLAPIKPFMRWLVTRRRGVSNIINITSFDEAWFQAYRVFNNVTHVLMWVTIVWLFLSFSGLSEVMFVKLVTFFECKVFNCGNTVTYVKGKTPGERQFPNSPY